MRGAFAAAMVVLLGTFATPAMAQISFGSPGDPPRLAFGAGAFDVTPSTSHKDSRTAGEFRGEDRFADTVGGVGPFFGAPGTTHCAPAWFFPVGFALNFARHSVSYPHP